MAGTTAIIPTYNSEEYIKGAIKSVDWCDEIILIDSQSTDDTVEIGKSHGATIVEDPNPKENHPIDYYRHYGVKAAANDIIVSIDTDERHPEKLQDWIKRIVDEGNASGSAIYAPTLNFLDDSPLRGAGQWPDYTPVMFDRTAVTILNRSHTWLDDSGAETIKLPAQDDLAVRHNFADSVWEHWRAQHRYAKIAGNYRDFSLLKLFAGPPWGFYTRFVKSEGWKYGLVGFCISLCWSWFLFETQIRAAIKKIRSFKEL
jgi:glycosyltransferase involved in cell wall biosynthesis